MNIKEAKEDIKNTVQAYLKKNSYGQYEIEENHQRPILLMGPPGIGKTQIMEQIARECGIGLVSYTITHHTRQSAVGLPFIREKTFQGRTWSVTEYTMSEILASIYQYMEDTETKEGILFIDEINCVSETLAPTMLQFLQCKTFGNQAVPKGWIIVAAGNPPEYNRSVHELDFVTLDRVRRMDVDADLPVFREYAREKNLHPFILSYLELRPGNFYKTENDVDGIRFVTARGWEDLSCLIRVYEDLGLAVNESVIGQFLQHRDVAMDVAAYYDLYKKYRDDYDISHILKGQAGSGIYSQLFQASFDERLSCVELLTDGLHGFFVRALRECDLTRSCFFFLKEYREGLRDRTSDDGLYRMLLDSRRKAGRQKEKTGLLTDQEIAFQADILTLLSGWCPEESSDSLKAFTSVKKAFDLQMKREHKAVGSASQALEYAFTFMENAFPQGEEMVVFVTELTMDPMASRFITENGCDRYFKYNQSLHIGSRRASLIADIKKDAIYQEASSWEF